MFYGWVTDNYLQVKESAAQQWQALQGGGGKLVEEGEDEEQTKHTWALA